MIACCRHFRSLLAMLLLGCSPAASEDPRLEPRDGGAGTSGGENLDADAGVRSETDAGSGGSSGGAAGVGGGASLAGAGGAAGANSAFSRSGAGAGGGAAPSGRAGAAGIGGQVGAAADSGTCSGVIPAAHSPFEAIEKLATTQDEVRILVYGQSISEQAWWSKTKAWLQQTYPGKKLVMEEHARGGCAAQCLIGRARWFLDGEQYNRLPEDVFAWKPDLIIFHVYGDHVDYGYIMRGFKEGCDAFENYRSSDGAMVPQVRCTPAQRQMSQGYEAPEVLVQSDFMNTAEPKQCPDAPTPADWDCFMNEALIPVQVAEHGYTLQDNFHDWPKYIRDNGLDPEALIQEDDTHLTEPAGTDVMFALTIPHLCYVP